MEIFYSEVELETWFVVPQLTLCKVLRVSVGSQQSLSRCSVEYKWAWDASERSFFSARPAPNFYKFFTFTFQHFLNPLYSFNCLSYDHLFSADICYKVELEINMVLSILSKLWWIQCLDYWGSDDAKASERGKWMIMFHSGLQSTSTFLIMNQDLSWVVRWDHPFSHYEAPQRPKNASPQGIIWAQNYSVSRGYNFKNAHYWNT